MNLNLSAFVNLLNANIFIDWYNRFLSLFPDKLHWLVSLLIIISIVIALVSLIMSNWLFILLAIVLLPVIYPVLKNFFIEMYTFLLYLWSIVGSNLPKP